VHPLNGASASVEPRPDGLVEGVEEWAEGGIHIDFSGKRVARRLARRVRPRVARTIKKYSAGSEEEQARNLVIEGDNLQAMTTLYRERGKIDFILTGPRYNTGNDWRYNDRWEEDPNDPGLGWVSLDDGARHTKWMRFMWPRLQMMKEMLKPTGVLAICIDHCELFLLGQMLDEEELFGEANRLGIINWQKSYSPRNDNTHVSTAAKRARAQCNKKNWPRLIFLKKGEGRPRLKRYLTEVKKGVVPMTYWADEDYDEPFVIGSTSWEHPQSGHSQSGFKELDVIVGKGHGFNTVKPLKLFSKLIQLWCPRDGTVLDPFAGSGTTGNAVLDLNNTADVNRRFILIEQGRPERGDSYARSLLADRLQRVISGDWADGHHEPLGGGYGFATLQHKVDADALLSMEREEPADTIIASHFDAATLKRDAPVRIGSSPGCKYLVARNGANEGFFLIWNGTKGNTDFTEETYEACARRG
jgi:DNA modification methylase